MTGGMMFKGTPGEWYTDAEFIRSSDGPDTYIVAEILNGKTADRNVIVAAPELLEAASMALSVMEVEYITNNRTDLAQFMEPLRAAIAKALGEQK